MAPKSKLKSKKSVKSKTKAVSPGDLKSEPDNQDFTKSAYVPVITPLKTLKSVKYDVNWVSIRRKIQKFNIKIPKVTIHKSVWDSYCKIFNRVVNNGR